MNQVFNLEEVWHEYRPLVRKYEYEKVHTFFPRLVERKLTRTYWKIWDKTNFQDIYLRDESAMAHKLKNQHKII